MSSNYPGIGPAANWQLDTRGPFGEVTSPGNGKRFGWVDGGQDGFYNDDPSQRSWRAGRQVPRPPESADDRGDDVLGGDWSDETLGSFSNEFRAAQTVYDVSTTSNWWEGS